MSRATHTLADSTPRSSGTATAKFMDRETGHLDARVQVWGENDDEGTTLHLDVETDAPYISLTVNGDHLHDGPPDASTQAELMADAYFTGDWLTLNRLARTVRPQN